MCLTYLCLFWFCCTAQLRESDTALNIKKFAAQQGKIDESILSARLLLEFVCSKKNVLVSHPAKGLSKALCG